MVHRLLTSALLALTLAITSLAATVAETRMAAAGGYCGTGAPQILLDSAGLPLLDGDGTPIAAPDCGVCHLALGLSVPPPTPVQAATLIPAAVRTAAAPPTPLSVRLDRHARAPPRLA